jgi:hypothetical protein
LSAPEDDLLKPSLRKRPGNAPYSLQTTFLTSFFGGPVAGVIVTGVNASRLRRPFGDAPALVVLALAVVAVEVMVFSHSAQIETWLKDILPSGSLRLVNQVLGIAVFGVGYRLHRNEHRSIDLQGIERPNGWIGGLACAAFGFAVQGLLVTGAMKLGAA